MRSYCHRGDASECPLIVIPALLSAPAIVSLETPKHRPSSDSEVPDWYFTTRSCRLGHFHGGLPVLIFIL